jgi:alkylation response protein AidB-like acyl-CoA dehydrogenase
MDFRVTEDQQALQEGIRTFCEGRVSIDQIRELETTGGFDAELWKELAEMGIFGLRLPESEGGVGLGNAEAVLVFEELGRALVPGPVVWTHLAAGIIDGAADGSTVVGGLDLCDGASGPHLVEHLDHLDVLLVLRADGVARIDPNSLGGKPVETPLDPLTPVHAVTVIPEGETIADAATSERLRLEGAALAAAALLGIAEQSQVLATAYAKEREQFNRVIGSFQAVKHILADCVVRQESARAAVYAAGATLDDPGVGDIERAVRGAKLVAGEAAWKNSRASIQVHGGMGYTWEIAAHYFLKRAWVLESVFGSVEEHADALAEKVASAA